MSLSFNIRLHSYRCFFRQHPIEIPIREGSAIALVGPNNSGKSAILKALYELRNVMQNMHSGSWGRVEGVENRYRTTLTIDPMLGSLADPLEVVPRAMLEVNREVRVEVVADCWSAELRLHGDALATRTVTLNVAQSGYDKSIVELQNVERLLAGVIYLGPYRNIATQNMQGGSIHYDLPMGETFVAQWKSLKNGNAILANRAVMSAQRVIADLLGYRTLDINATEDGRSLKLVFNGDQAFQLSEVGSGIAQLILAIITVAHRKPTILLIDEPELHLHPSMQLRFLEALSSHTSFATLFATHSVGLARQYADVVLVTNLNGETGKASVNKLDEVTNYGHLLGEMSYSQFSAIGGKALLLVEGTTEVKTMRAFLRKLGVETEVLIIPLGGSAMIAANRASELEEFQRLGLPVFVVVDSERECEGEEVYESRKVFVQDCEHLFGRQNVLITNDRAVENYFTDQAVKVVKGDNYRALSPYERLDSVNPAWAKSENWKIADAMSEDDLLATDLGKFLKRLGDLVS